MQTLCFFADNLQNKHQGWETFEIVNVAGVPPPPPAVVVAPAAGKVALRSAHGKFLCANDRHGVEWNRDQVPGGRNLPASWCITKQSTQVGAWETLTMVPAAPGSVAFLSCHGRYLCATPEGKLEWDRQNIGPWEQFHITYVNANHITLRSAHNKAMHALGVCILVIVTRFRL